MIRELKFSRGLASVYNTVGIKARGNSLLQSNETASHMPHHCFQLHAVCCHGHYVLPCVQQKLVPGEQTLNCSVNYQER